MEKCGHFLYHRRGGKYGQGKILRILSEWEEQQAAVEGGGPERQETEAAAAEGGGPERQETAAAEGRWGLTQQELQKKLGIQSGSISEIVGKMEAAGLLCRRRHERDKRKICLTMTEKGRQTLAAMREEKARKDAVLFAALRWEEQEQLQGLLEKLLDDWKVFPDCGCSYGAGQKE